MRGRVHSECPEGEEAASGCEVRILQDAFSNQSPWFSPDLNKLDPVVLISVSVPFLTRVWVPTSLGSGHASSSRATVKQNHASRFGPRPNISVKAHIIIHAVLADLHIFGFREGKTLKILLICFKCVLQVKVAVLLFIFSPHHQGQTGCFGDD